MKNQPSGVRAIRGVIGVLLALLPAGGVHAATLAASETFGDGDLDAGAEVIVQRAPNTFWWADPDGDGTPGPSYTSPGLNMAGYSLTRNQSTTGFTLNLDHTGDGSVGGDITNGGNMEAQATAWNGNAGPITITNAGHISVNNINASSQNMNPGRITVRHTGRFLAGTVFNQTFFLAQGEALFSGNLAGVNTVEELGNTFSLNGTLLAYQSSAAATNLRKVWIEKYQTVRILGYSTAGDGRAYSIRAENAGSRSGAGCDVTMTNIGSGGITLRTPDGKGGIFTGSSDTTDNWMVRMGSVVLSTTGPVELHHLVTGVSAGANGSQYAPGNATILAGGNLSITGDILLHDPNSSGGGLGTLSLTATNSGSTVTVNDLRLDRLLAAKFSAPGNSRLAGVLTGTDGNPASGLGNIGTSLRVPAGQVIRYLPAKNPALDGKSYTLADLAGTPSAGGQLKAVSRGTVVTFN